jgi:hypothetical protein
MTESTVPPPPPPDALTDALDAVNGFAAAAQYYVPDIADQRTCYAIKHLIEAVQYLRLAASILGAEVGALNEVTR